MDTSRRPTRLERHRPRRHGTALVSAALSVVGLAVTAFASVPPLQAQEPLSYTWGTDDARIVLVEFVDFGCGACAEFHRDSYDSLFQEYVETGEVRWTLVPFVSGQFPHSMEAAEAASCAALQPLGLRRMTARLFERQDEWSRASDRSAMFVEYARDLGLDAPEIEACLADHRMEGGIRAAGERARELGVRATPTFFMDDYPIPGALPLDFFRRLFDRRLAGGP